MGIREIKPCTLELKLKPGEGCRYVANNNEYRFDFIFYVGENAAGFWVDTVKTPSSTYSKINSFGYFEQIALNGRPYVSPKKNNDLRIRIDLTDAQMCVSKAEQEKCFSAIRNRDGSWTVNKLPLPTSSK